MSKLEEDEIGTEQGDIPPDFAEDFGGGEDGKLTMPQDRGIAAEVDEGNMSMGKINPEQIVEAQNQLGREMDDQLKDYFDGVEKSKVEKDKMDNNGHTRKPEEDMQAKLIRMNVRLYERLAPLMRTEESRLRQKQYTGTRKVLRYVGWRPKPPKKDEVLDNVINGLIVESEEITERRKLRMSNRKREREEVRGKYRTIAKRRNSDLDKYDQGEKHLTSIEEQFTTNVQARDDYIDQKSQPGCKSDVDVLLQSTTQTIEKLEEKRVKVQEGQETLYEQIQDYNAQLDSLKAKRKESDVHYFIAKDKYQKSRKAANDLTDIRDDRNKRESLLKAYTETIKEDRTLGFSRSVAEEGKTVINDIRDICTLDLTKGNGSGSHDNGVDEKITEYEEEMVKRRENEIAKARADRYFNFFLFLKKFKVKKMIEIDINPGFKARALKAHRNSSLSEIVKACEKSISRKIRISPGVKVDDIGNYDEIMNIFLGTYYSLTEEMDKRSTFKREKDKGYYTLIRTYSMYASSKSVLNKINDDDIGKIRSLEIIPPGSNLTYSDINQASDYSLLSGIFEKLKNVKIGNNISVLKYNYFSFFDKLRDLCKNFIKTNVHPDTVKDLNQINIYKTGLSFNEIAPPQKKEFARETEKNKAPSSNVENLPTELPSYDHKRAPKIEKVIGNVEGITTLRAAMIRTLKYDSQIKQNPFSMNGNSFKDAFLVHGDPGVGKNFTVDALINHYLAAAKKYDIDVEVVDLSQGIHSMFRDRSAQIFERYISLENEGDRAYINIIDEAEGIFTINEHGEMCEESKKLLREMKKAINNSDKRNTLYIFMTNYPNMFEAALKQRFTPLEMKGATSKEQFTDLLKQELGINADNLSPQELEKLGEVVYGYRIKLQDGNGKKTAASEYDPLVPITGRNVSKIASQFTSGDDRYIVTNEDTILKASTEQIQKLLPKLCEKPTYDNVLAAIHSHMNDVVKSITETTARYNGK
jgi:hypothetical protein